MPKKQDKREAEQRVSLHGVSLEQALRGILRVPTPPEARSAKGVKKPKGRRPKK